MSSAHTKHHLQDLHPNIAVFRHPDHLPDKQEITASITESLENFSLDAKNLAKMSGDALKGIYGMNDDVILYWAHHEKLCLIDGRTAFMGGLDMCFGRWDTNQHALTDVHPENLNEIVFPGQDYNNARVLDFQDVSNWEKNQLDRKNSSRMGWSDVSVSLHGHVVEDLRRHFVERWNFIYDSKYEVRNDSRYSRLALYGRPSSSQRPHTPQQPGYQQHQQQQQYQQQQPAQQHQYQQQQPSQNQSGSQQAGFHQPVSPQPGGGLSMAPPAPPLSSKPGATSSYQPSPAQSPSPGAPPPYTYTGDSFPPPPPGPPPSQGHSQTQTPTHQSQAPYFPPPPTHSGQSQTQSPNQAQSSYYQTPHTQGQEQHSQTRGVNDYYEGSRGHGDHERGFVPQRFREELTQYGNVLRGQLAGQIHQYQDRYGSLGGPNAQPRGNMCCQIVRSCSKWSNGTPTEHSIADAYAAIIRNSEHFIYIENQFFITATGDSQKPVQNKIGAAIVERILRAAKSGQKYKVFVVIPSVPCFAGDLADDSTLGTRAIMEFQYNSINRGGNSIMELIAKEGHNPMDYIRFYNLRNYDRINLSGPLAQAEQRSGVNYEDARKQHDVNTVGQGGYGPGAPRAAFDTTAPYQQYQQAARDVGGAKSGSGRWDSVSECYMLHGPDLRNVPWDGPAEAEIDAFVTEELYVHSKVFTTTCSSRIVRLTNAGHGRRRPCSRLRIGQLERPIPAGRP